MASPSPDVLCAMQKWADCENLKIVPKAALSKLTKEQRLPNATIQDFMSKNQLKTLELPLGYVKRRKLKESVHLNMDVCEAYMDPETLARMEKEQTISKCTFSIVQPKRKKARIGSPMSTTA